MDIRMLRQPELLPALHLVWDVFAEDVAPEYTPEGVVEFQKFIKYKNIEQMYLRKEITFFGAFEGSELCGTIAVMSGSHICLFYVKKECQGRKMGRHLFEAVRQYCIQTVNAEKITVNAAPKAVPKYIHLGFQATGEQQNVNGICYVPMELIVPTVMRHQKKQRTGLIIGGIIAATLLITTLCIFLGLGVIRKAISTYEQKTQESYDTPYDDGNNKDNYDDDTYDWYDGGEGNGGMYEDGKEELSGLEAVPVYKDEKLPYEVEDQAYTYSDTEKKSVVIDFQVKYPQLKGLEGEIEQKINDELKSCAMDTVDKIYTNPDDTVKEEVLGADAPALISYVDYKVSYMGKDFISVIYQDYSYKGDGEVYYVNLRTKNINLKDGTVYEVKDIVDINDRFTSEWLSIMRDEASNDLFLSELEAEEMQKALKGDSLGGVYAANFFVHKDGIEIGFDFNYSAEDTHNLGFAWVTAPFDFNAIREYKTKSEFWGLID